MCVFMDVCMYVGVCECVCLCKCACECMCPWRPEEGVVSSGAAVTSSYKPTDGDAVLGS